MEALNYYMGNRCARCGCEYAWHWLDGKGCNGDLVGTKNQPKGCDCAGWSRPPKRGPLIIGKGMSPALRFGFEPCPTCGGRKEKSSNSRALNGPVRCADRFHVTP